MFSKHPASAKELKEEPTPIAISTNLPVMGSLANGNN
jgi:hypothetical protein